MGTSHAGWPGLVPSVLGVEMGGSALVFPVHPPLPRGAPPSLLVPGPVGEGGAATFCWSSARCRSARAHSARTFRGSMRSTVLRSNMAVLFWPRNP